MSKYPFISICFCLALIAVIFMSHENKSNGPPGCFAGEPPNFTNCTSCHSGTAVNSGTANIVFNLGGAENGYYPDSTYTITLSVQKSGMEAGGFQFIALQDNNSTVSPGTITLTEPGRMTIVDQNNPHAQGCVINNKVWIEHQYAGILSDSTGKSQWSFRWKAPNNNAGNISFYFATLESNFDLTDDGDRVYTRNTSVPYLGPTSTTILPNQMADGDISIYPNPSYSKIFVSTADFSEWEQIQITDLTGFVIKDYKKAALLLENNNFVLDLDNMHSGIYILSLQGKKRNINKLITVL